jgi:beta-phosphoglucomutase-like phosphatase (HAD superfamily)
MLAFIFDIDGTLVDSNELQYHGTWAHDHLVAAVKDDIIQGHVAP